MSPSLAPGSLTAADAKALTAAALAKAQEIGVPMNVAVVDAGGNLVHFEHQDHAWIGGASIAIDKAWTARAFDMETGQLAQFTQPGQPAFGLNTSNDSRVVIYKGGFPVVRDGVVVGAIGVCGGHADQDEVVGRAAFAGFGAAAGHVQDAS